MLIECSCHKEENILSFWEDCNRAQKFITVDIKLQCKEYNQYKGHMPDLGKIRTKKHSMPQHGTGMGKARVYILKYDDMQ
jgi:hypothetical protein